MSILRARLDRVRRELIDSPVFGSGRPDEANKADEEALRFERLADNVALILRELNSTASLLRLREQQLQKVPLGQRYSAQQSIRQLSENVRLLRDDAQSLAELIRNLLDRNGVLNSVQKAKSILDLIEDLQKAAGHDADALASQTLHATKQDAVYGAQTGGSPVAMGGVLNLIVFIYLGLKVAQKKLQSKATGA